MVSKLNCKTLLWSKPAIFIPQFFMIYKKHPGAVLIYFSLIAFLSVSPRVGRGYTQGCVKYTLLPFSNIFGFWSQWLSNKLTISICLANENIKMNFADISYLSWSTHAVVQLIIHPKTPVLESQQKMTHQSLLLKRPEPCNCLKKTSRFLGL